jgi:hypothetical protein
MQFILQLIDKIIPLVEESHFALNYMVNCASIQSNKMMK